MNAAGKIMEIFTNTWSYNSLGLIYDPVRNQMRYVHESQSNQSSPTVFDVDRMAHTVVVSFALSAQKRSDGPGSWTIARAPDTTTIRTRISSPITTGTWQTRTTTSSRSTPTATILNAWEMDDEVGSNDSADGSEIDSIIDIAVVPGSPTRYFATAAYDGALVYEIELHQNRHLVDAQ
ncbi:MAG: hypothetical protein U5L04_07130 [Trueperaceae bacterium]|nr:hypothetical protein [Trueperaceae bacterium]